MFPLTNPTRAGLCWAGTAHPPHPPVCLPACMFVCLFLLRLQVCDIYSRCINSRLSAARNPKSDGGIVAEFLAETKSEGRGFRGVCKGGTHLKEEEKKKRKKDRT